jgi:hypothetical protein
MNMIQLRRSALLPAGIAFFAAGLTGQKAAPASQPAAGPILSFTATTAHVMGAPDAIRIDVMRWSTDQQRQQLMSAWEMKGAVGGTGREPGGRGAASGPAAAAIAGDPTAAGNDSPAAPPARTRPRAKGPSTPEESLAMALKQASTVGYLWSSEVAGYALRYAGKVTAPDGTQRIILITDRRLGKINEKWTPDDAGTPANYDFSVIELRVNPKGEGEGKISLTGKVAPDSMVKIPAPGNYVSLPVVLTRVKQRIVAGN